MTDPAPHPHNLLQPVPPRRHAYFYSRTNEALAADRSGQVSPFWWPKHTTTPDPLNGLVRLLAARKAVQG